uniref:Uncharacterized protein LOC114328317 n=1 Tax=Diabrotica virgifera virgifera TaxID=50390 RepID=A0A6P7FIA4_DIAVI
MVNIGGFGSNHDSAIFKASDLGCALLNGNLDLPPPNTLTETDLLINHYILADSALALHQNIIRPYTGNNLGEKKNIFNYRVSRGRRTIENAFGILSQRSKILRRTIQVELEVSELIVQARVVLHNFLQCSERIYLTLKRDTALLGLAIMWMVMDYYILGLGERIPTP